MKQIVKLYNLELYKAIIKANTLHIRKMLDIIKLNIIETTECFWSSK